MTKLSKFILFLSSLTILLLFYLIAFTKNSPDEYHNYDLIDHFNKATTRGLSSNKHINSNFTAHYSANLHRNFRTLIGRTFANPRLSSSNTKPFRISKDDVSAGAVRIMFTPTKKKGARIIVNFRKRSEINYNTFELTPTEKGKIDISATRGEEKYRAASKIIHFEINKPAVLNLFFYLNRIIVTTDHKTIINIPDPSYKEAGSCEVIANSMPADDKYVIKFVEINANQINKFGHFISHYLWWCGHNFKLAFPDQKTINPNIFYMRHTESSPKVTKRVIALPVGAELSYKLLVPQQSYLEFEYWFLRHNNNIPETTQLNIEIHTPQGQSLGRSESFRSISKKSWSHHKFDMQKYQGKEIELKFYVKDTGDKPENNDTILFLANPVLRQRRNQENKRNIMLISIDTLRQDHLSCYGYRRKTTPNIDKFAKGNILFKNAFANSSWTLPSHISLFTSKYPLESGHKLASLWETHNQSRIPFQIHTLTEFLKDAGYKTLAITGMGYLVPRYNFDQGFEEYWEIMPTRSEEIDEEIEICLDLIEKSRDLNWFVFFHTYEVHFPYLRNYYEADALDGQLSKLIAKYDSGIRFADNRIAKILNKIETLGLRDDTLIIILSDHGESFYDHKTGKPEKLNEGKHGHNLYDELLKIPLIVGGHKEFRKGVQIEDPVSLVDIMPTILDFAGSDLPTGIRGNSLVPIIRNKHIENRLLYAEAVFTSPKSEKKALRFKKHKLIFNNEYKTPDLKYEFYDLEKDSLEKHNISGKNSRMYNILKLKLQKIIESIAKNAKKLPKQKVKHDHMSDEMREQLRALGYLGN